MAENRIVGNVVPFASQAVGTDRTVFGDVTQSDDINLNVTANFKEGWGILQLNEDPTMQDFNALGFTQGSLISYLYQQGIAQWDAGQEYLTDSICVKNGKIFISLSGTVATPNVGNDPTLDTLNWKDLFLDYTKKADFQNSLTGNGYQKLPNGLIIQWGSVSMIGMATPPIVVFPLSFSNVFSVSVTSYNADRSFVPVGVSNSSFSLQYSAHSSLKDGDYFAYWFAIGN